MQAPKAIALSADLRSGLQLKMQVELPSSKDATELVAQAKGQLGAAALILQESGIGTLVQKVEFQAESSWTVARWTLSEAELASLVSAALPRGRSSIDNAPANDENPAPKSELERDDPNGNPDPNASNEIDLRRQGQAD